MAQVKKEAVREAIVAAADRLFSRQGYHRTTLSQIAAGAGVSTANLYVYFRSKLDILYSIYEPWLRRRFIDLEAELRRAPNPQRRVFKLLHALWCDIPGEKRGFANNFIQAISTATPSEGYRPELLRWTESRIAAMLRDSLPPERRALIGRSRFAHVLVMAFDGYVIGQHLKPGRACDDKTIALMASLLLGEATSSPRRKSRPRR